MVCLVDSGIGSEAMFATLLWGDGTPAYGYGGERGTVGRSRARFDLLIYDERGHDV